MVDPNGKTAVVERWDVGPNAYPSMVADFTEGTKIRVVVTNTLQKLAFLTASAGKRLDSSCGLAG